MWHYFHTLDKTALLFDGSLVLLDGLQVLLFDGSLVLLDSLQVLLFDGFLLDGLMMLSAGLRCF